MMDELLHVQTPEFELDEQCKVVEAGPRGEQYPCNGDFRVCIAPRQEIEDKLITRDKDLMSNSRTGDSWGRRPAS